MGGWLCGREGNEGVCTYKRFNLAMKYILRALKCGEAQVSKPGWELDLGWLQQSI